MPFGVWGHDDFFQSVALAHNTSTTTAACIEGIADLIFGKGIYSKDETKNDLLHKLIPQEELKRVSFDLKLFGNAAFQVYWDDTHTKIIKFYHVPVQYLRAEKIYNNPKIENYYYCTDWNDQRKIKDKKKKIYLSVVVMDGASQLEYLLSTPHYLLADRLFVFDGQSSAIRYGINPSWRGLTPYVALLSGKGEVKYSLGKLSHQQINMLGN